MASQKPFVIQEIEALLNITLSLAPDRGGNLLGGLMPFKRGMSKYAMNGEKLIGLNLANVGLTDEQLKALYRLTCFIPGDLLALNVSDNELTEFQPFSILSLQQINVEDNPLTFPPVEIVNQGNEAILRYLKELASQGEREIYEVKMLILGEGEVGKTTFWNLLQDPDYPVPLPPDQQPSTVGIQIKEGWKFKHPDHPEQDFLVNLWDFGGQPIQHMTHQFFLTRRSFYVLLADGRRNVANFSYWFKIINLLGCDHKDEEPMPVMVILNKKGSHNAQFPYDPEYIKEAFPKLKLIRYEVDFAIKDFQLKGMPAAIQDILSQQIKHLPFKIPRYWDLVRQELYSLREQKDHIDLATFTGICKSHGIEDKEQMLDLSQLMHDLGVILHHQDDLMLKDFIVLNPDWALNAVYEILKHDKVGKNQGRFDQKLLANVWDEAGLSPFEQARLMNLMLKDSFEVCFRAYEGGKEIYIAPQLLSGNKPAFNWNSDMQMLRYTFQYPFMPKGLIGRLIVRLNENLQTVNDTKAVWVKGMLLQEKDKPCEALVTEKEDNKTGGKIIHIEVKEGKAEERRFFLQRIRGELGKIHERSFPNLSFEEKIPCFCSLCKHSTTPHFFELSNIKNRKKSTIECPISAQDVKTQQLLGLVFDDRSMLKDADSFLKMDEEEVSERPLKIFFSYSKEDRKKLEQLQKFLAPLKMQGKIELWDDNKILAGDEWDGAIRSELEEADMILLLISIDFLVTDYVWEVEIKRAMEKHEAGLARVVPVVLDHCDWEDMPFGKLSGLPIKGKPVSAYNNENEAWSTVVKGLKRVIEEFSTHG